MQSETAEDTTTERQIHDWIVECIRRGRFCPNTPGLFSADTNVSSYLTSGGDENGEPTVADGGAPARLRLPPGAMQGVTRENAGMLRISAGKMRDREDLFTPVSQRIKELYGPQLNDTCHMGPEESIYANALKDMFGWEFDFRRVSSRVLAPLVYACHARARRCSATASTTPSGTCASYGCTRSCRACRGGRPRPTPRNSSGSSRSGQTRRPRPRRSASTAGGFSCACLACCARAACSTRGLC